MRMIAVVLCGALAACSQTTTGPGSATNATNRATAPKMARQGSAQDRCGQAVAKVQQEQMNAAMVGSALSMAGGLGGFGGRGGAVVAQAASIGGSMVQAKARSNAQSSVQRECLR